MKYYVDSKILESDKPLSLREIFDKLEFGTDVLGAEINGEIKDFYFNPADESKIYPIFLGNEKSLTLIRHSTAHILAQAVQSIYPDTKVTIGPVIEDGFYYDFYTDRNFTEDDLKLFENKMHEILEKNVSFEKEVINKEKALEIFSNMGETFKKEIINDLDESQEISLYKQGDWFDLCRGPHLPNSTFIKSFKLLSVAG